MEAIDVTLISSVYNEEQNLMPLVERVVAVMRGYPFAGGWEYILVDDGSTDGSARVLEELHNRYPQLLRIFRHGTRQGQKGCFMTGFTNARGRISVLMDADLQVLPEEIPRLLKPVFDKKMEMVCTYNDVTRGGMRGRFGTWVSRFGNVFMKLLFRSPVQDAGANFMAVKTHYLQGVRLVENDQRYLLPIAMRRGLKQIAEVGCVFHKRRYGRSKYSYFRKMLLGVPEMVALKMRLMRGFYDAPGSREWGHCVWKPEPWDSFVLGLPAARMIVKRSQTNGPEEIRRLAGCFSEAVRDASNHGIRFLSLRIPEEAAGALAAAQKAGFRVIESYLTFELDPKEVSWVNSQPAGEANGIRLAEPREAEEVALLAERSLRHYRFLSDPFIPRKKARFSRRQWVLNAFRSGVHTTFVFVAEENKRIAGFILLKPDPEHHQPPKGIIDLLAVDGPSTGRGIGKALLQQGIRHFAQDGRRVEVGTQGKNIPAIRLYTVLGFRLKETQTTLHWMNGSST